MDLSVASLIAVCAVAIFFDHPLANAGILNHRNGVDCCALCGALAKTQAGFSKAKQSRSSKKENGALE